MPRRVNLPSADDLFRATDPTEQTADPAGTSGTSGTSGVRGVRVVPDAPAEPEKKGASGRIRHDEKMTVYVTSEELLDLERTRLELRARHGLAVDRGRLVREAIDTVLADFHEHGEQSLLVRRLREE